MVKTALTLCLCLLLPLVAQAATLNLQVTTDRDAYAPGQTVHWTILAWSDAGTHAGIASLGVDLVYSDTLGLSAAETTADGLALANSYYSPARGFELLSPGFVDNQWGLVRDISVYQRPAGRVLNVGNDGVPHVLATGTLLPPGQGPQTLTANLVAGNYWPDATGNALPFGLVMDQPAEFTVGGLALPGDANGDGTVDDRDLNVVLAHWGDAGGWAQGDFDASGVIDDRDLSVLLSHWGDGAAAAIPEPASLALVAGGLLALRRRRA